MHKLHPVSSTKHSVGQTILDITGHCTMKSKSPATHFHGPSQNIVDRRNRPVCLSDLGQILVCTNPLARTKPNRTRCPPCWRKINVPTGKTVKGTNEKRNTPRYRKQLSRTFSASSAREKKETPFSVTAKGICRWAFVHLLGNKGIIKKKTGNRNIHTRQQYPSRRKEEKKET